MASGSCQRKSIFHSNWFTPFSTTGCITAKGGDLCS